MFTRFFEHTWESIKEHLEKIFDITDETQAVVISLQKRLDIALERIEALESKLSSTAVFATMVPERNSQRIEPRTMIVRNPMALGADALGEIPLVDTVAEER
jgi:hypothetical protein